MDGLAYWGLLDGPGGSRKEGRKEVGERYPRGVFIRKCLNAKSHHRVDRYWYSRLGFLVGVHDISEILARVEKLGFQIPPQQQSYSTL